MLKQTKIIVQTDANELQKKKASYTCIICNGKNYHIGFFLKIIFIVKQPNPNTDLVNGTLDVSMLVKYNFCDQANKKLIIFNI